MQSQSENAHIQLFKILDKYFILHFCFFYFVKALIWLGVIWAIYDIN
jgi:hypothetical protein